MDAFERTQRALREHHVIGRGHEREPLVDYALIVTTFLAMTGASVARALRRGAAPERVPLTDTLLLGLAAARLSRLFTKEKVTRVVRAPFTEVDEGASLDEVREHARGSGATRAIGELLTCPRCFGMWSSALLCAAYLWAPGPTRTASTILSASLISDLANVRFAHARKRGRARAERLAREHAARTAWGDTGETAPL